MAARSAAGSKSDVLYGISATGSVDGRPEATVVSERSVHAATESGIYTSAGGAWPFTLRYHC
ncbi:hypothetical protein JOF29_000093 [Kribbella aluminosa]|uniref:Uncharacterized protein n=1 Tax=Kribbella aluminosa TaxID=416017 RepID=A0ABS4UBL2_9ACTN|nr:hypothetical protein [Kribbella aluminosa]MBP2349010.1 hypothetical protein [Kribbella aluminosa]